MFTGGTLQYGRSVAPAAPLNRGLLARWKMLPRGQAGATWDDLLGRVHMKATSVGPSSATLGWGPTRRPGGLGEYRLTGGAYLLSQAIDGPFLNIPIVSVALWIKPKTYGSSTGPRIFVRTVGTAATGGWDMRLDSVTNGIIINMNWQGTGIWTLPSVITLGTWTHIGFSYNRGATTNNPTISVNGVATAATVTSTPTGIFETDAGASLLIGNRAALSREFDGALDDLCVYNRLLTAVEWRNLYQATKSAYGVELVHAPRVPAFRAAAAGRVSRNIHSTGLGMNQGQGFGIPAGGRYLP